MKRTEDEWDKNWRAEENRLGRQKQRCQFNADLQAINVQLDDLSRQLAAMRNQYGSSLAAARVTSQAFFQFEKTIQLLEVRIGTFSSTAQQVVAEDDGDKAQLEDQVTRMKNKWSSFHRQVGETRKKIDLSVDYFTLVEDVEQSFRQGGQLLMSVARKSTQVKTPEEAQLLLKEVEGFIKPEEVQLEKKLTKISQLAVQLYGPESSERIRPVMKEKEGMLDSFSTVNAELSTLAVNLKAAEEDRFKQAETQAAVQESLDAARAEAASARASIRSGRSSQGGRSGRFGRGSSATKASASGRSCGTAETFGRRIGRQSSYASQTGETRRTAARGPNVHNFTARRHGGRKQSRPIHLQVNYSCNYYVNFEVIKIIDVNRVTGKPTPIITWLKDGMAIANNPDYQTTFDERDGTCCLRIDETFADDSARFTCQASNLAGFAQTTAVLRVQGTINIV